ncbi:hypothetical protein GCM10027176_58910 [Actinoallomurus bryophytorum]|uniref:Uncharacterized protein n=1 Tax=Actinoallomurus bryophytorum TaxID=1490222 RepID=A0A543CH26_9ACTN|nr:hypothetical protein [Actinoallomurus bryophytorum]TQL96412.1 hypothetical protein FB559_1940 [Actinoallomurus bryophytorum]
MTRPSVRRSGKARRGARADAPGPSKVETEEIGGHYLLRPAGAHTDEDTRLVTEVAGDDATVVVVAVADDLADDLRAGLGEVLGHVHRHRPVLLAMSGAGDEPPEGSGDAPLAQRIADAYDLTVVAPVGDVIVVPGGSLFAYSADEVDPGWRWFAPGEESRPLGPRWPVPEWGTPLADTAATRPMTSAPTDRVVYRGKAARATPGGSRAGIAVMTVPAGLLLRPADTPAPEAGNLPYAIAPTDERPSVLVAGQVAVGDAATILAEAVARPEWRRHPLRLVPTDTGDVLPLGQALARDLGVAVEVLTGPPVRLDTSEGPHVVVLDEEGRPAWTPFTSSVLCRPPGADGTTSPPEPLDWEPPAAGMRVADATYGVLRFGEVWRLAVTRAGLWAYPADADPERYPAELTTAQPVVAETVRIDIGLPGRTVDDEVWLLLDELLRGLPHRPRAHLLFSVHGTATADAEEALRVLARRHAALVETGETRKVEEERIPEGRVPAPPGAPSASPVGKAVTSSPPGPPREAEAVPGSPAGAPPTMPAARPPAASGGPGRGRPSSSAAASGAVVVSPGRPSTDEERAAFRAMVGLGWDTHAAPVRRTFSRLPAIAAAERAAAAVDLVAVRLYLTSAEDEGFGPEAVRAGGEAARPYLACLASGLARLPTYRGAVLHGAGTRARTDLVGTVLTGPGAIGGVPLSAESRAGWPPTATVYVIWSHTARRVAALFDAGETRRKDVVFGPGSRFAVLDVRRGDADTPDLVLLRELPARPAGADEVQPSGRLALTRLDEALKFVGPAGDEEWPAHCLGPVGDPEPPPAAASGRTAEG